MKQKTCMSCLIIVVILSIIGCSMGTNIYIKKDQFINNYEMIKKIVREEALNNGWTLQNARTTETKPSQYNNWEGLLMYKLETMWGTDTLRVEFKLRGNEIHMWILATAHTADAEGAKKAITARLNKLFKGSIRIASKAAEESTFM